MACVLKRFSTDAAGSTSSTGNRSAGNGVEQIAKEDSSLPLGEFFEGGIFLGVGRLHVSVQAPDDFRRIGVQLGAFAEAVEAGVTEFRGGRGESRCVHAQIIGQQLIQTFLAGKIGGVFKKFRAQIFGQPHNFKKLAVAIARDGRHAHARENFAQASVYGGAHAFGSASFQRFRELISQIRQYRARSRGHQQRHVMRVKNLRGFHHQRHIPQSFAHHRFPDSGRSEQRRQAGAVLADSAIGKEEESRASAATQRGS